MNSLTVILLAAGLGKRMKSPLPKPLHKILGKPMIEHVLEAASSATKTVVVVGHGKEQVIDRFSDDIIFVTQEEQKGTGHAVQCAVAEIDAGDVLVLFADTPLIKESTIEHLLEKHRSEKNVATLITAELDEPAAFGRIVRSGEEFQKIVEFKNADEETRRIKEINSGIAVFDGDLLKEKLALLTDDNAQGEFLLTDVFEMLVQDQKRVGILKLEDADEILGVNDRYALSVAEDKMLERIRKEHMINGVTIHMPSTVYIEKGVTIEAGAEILQGTRLVGDTSVAENAIIGPFTELNNTKVGAGSSVDRTVALDSVIGENCKIGPFAYIRPNSDVGNEVKVGDFVELKNTKIGKNTKVPHLSYIGDGVIGERTNIGCGTIFVNYDGEKKHKTNVGNDAFIGCNANLVAPITVGDNTFVAAGATLTKDLPDDSFAISRVPQDNRPNKKSKK